MEFNWKEIPIVEPSRWGVFRVGWKIPKEKLLWNSAERALLHILSALQKKGKLPKWEPALRGAMARSHRNARKAYETNGRVRRASVLDIDSVIGKLVG